MLKKYDEKLVRIEDVDGNIYEGEALYYDEEYNEIEYGESEESIDLFNIKFYPFAIASIEEIDNYSGKYGLLEEQLVLNFFDDVDDYLYEEDEITKKRILECIKDNMDKLDKEKANKLLEKYGG